MKKITSLYSGDDGESHFKEIELPLDKNVHGGEFDEASIPIRAVELIFRESKGEVGAGDHMGWHTAPRRQMYIMLGGTLEIEVGDGSKRLFESGDVFIAEDTVGRGHLSRAKNRRAVIVPLE